MKRKRAAQASDALAWASRQLGVELSAEQVARLQGFGSLLRDRAIPLGFVAAADAPRLRERHLLDCVRAALTVGPNDESACDLGSGAGLPGVVVAICRPRLRIVLAEPQHRRAAFLELAVERLALQNVLVEVTRAETLSGPFDLCFARAFAALGPSWEVAKPLLRPGGRLVYFSGTARASTGVEQPLPPGAGAVEVLSCPFLESAGPLVIMSRK